MPLNRNEAENFLCVLDPGGDRFTFQTFDDVKDRKDKSLVRILHGTLAQHWDELCALNDSGAGIYVTVNRTDLKGRKAENVIGIRATFIDLDGAPLDPVQAEGVPPPIVINETSPGRWHVYWRAPDGMPLDEFTELQKRLISYFHSDQSIHDLSRVMRIPGFVHRKGAPFDSHIIHIDEEAEPPDWSSFLPKPEPELRERPQQRYEPNGGGPDHDELPRQWERLNQIALDNLDAWVPRLYPSAKRHGSNYRVSSKDLGRNLEEDLSFSPAGIKDFGLHDMGDPNAGGRTPTGCIRERFNCDFKYAVRWLCEALAEDPDRYLPRQHKTDGRQGKSEQPQPRKGPITVRSKRGFMDDYIPLHYQIDGITQNRFIYSVTGKTGDAKTAVALLIATMVGSADPVPYLAGHRVEKGRVIYIVGENPDDVRMRVIGMDYKRGLAGIECSGDNIWFIAGIFEIEKMIQAIEADVKQHGEVNLVIVDTSAAYFFGNEELSNTQMGAYARLLRKLSSLPGGPCVLVLCHPIKHATEQTQLLPRGGGAFLAEMDGNLTLWRRGDDVIELHWTGKFRGPDFRPVCFRLESIKDAPRLKDSKGRQMTTVQAVVMTQQEAEGATHQTHSDQDQVLIAMLGNPEGSLREWAEKIGWRYSDGNANHKKVEAILKNLLNEKGRKLVRQERGGHWQLTDAGKDEARPIAVKEFHKAHPMQRELALHDGP
jgi:hypothetical protein